MEPSGPTLLRLEQQARRAGTGLGTADLNGRWQLQQVWPKAGQHPSTLSSQLLRSLNARLEISDGGEDLDLCNAVTLGLLDLLDLRFWFDRVVLTLAGRIVLERSLQVPSPDRRPFFALIQRDSSGWLAARGRGGGLALWQLAGDPGLRR